MRSIVVRYRTHADQSDANDALVRAVFDELATGRHAGFRYACFRAGDEFVHLAVVDDSGVNPLAELASFAAFQAGLADRCAIEPMVSDAALVGSYHCNDPR